MSFITEPERKTKIAKKVDILVCGGGFGGFAAAFSAAKMGHRVMLIEKYGFLGGLVTSSLVITTPPLNNGINLEIVKRLKANQVYVETHNLGTDFEDMEMFSIDPEIVKYEFVNMLLERKVELLLHTYIVDVISKDDHLEGVIVETKAGRMAILAKTIVDATGDADIAAFAGAPFEEVRKPMTMMYNLVQVNVRKALDYLDNWGNLKNYVKQAIDNNELKFDLGVFPAFGAPGVHAA
ncbi:MAG: FAD-dependent oxidoreductase, partial [Anaerolineales bacterium]